MWKKPTASESLAKQSAAVSLLIAGRVEDAAKLLDADYVEGDFLLPASVGVPRAIITLGLDYSDLPMSPEIRRRIAATIAYWDLAGDKQSKKELVAIAGGEFPCPAIEEWLTARGFSPRDEEDGTLDHWEIAELYAHTKSSEAANLANLTNLMEIQYGGGVVILVAPTDCAECLRASARRYRWGELDELPKVPLHWGCRCCYNGWAPD